MEENKFFRFVWRFNGIVIMALAVLGLTSLTLAIASEISRNVNRTSNRVVNIDREAEIAEELEIDRYREIENTPYLIFPLTSKQSYRRNSYSSKSTSSTRNFLFVDSRTNQKQWLLPNNESSIISDRSVIASDENSSPQAVLYTLVQKDTNQDRRLTASDLLTIGISLPDGRNYQPIVTGIDDFLGYKPIDDSQIVAIYKQQAAIYAQTVELKDRAFSVTAKPTVIYKPDS